MQKKKMYIAFAVNCNVESDVECHVNNKREKLKMKGEYAKKLLSTNKSKPL